MMSQEAMLDTAATRKSRLNPAAAITVSPKYPAKEMGIKPESP